MTPRDASKNQELPARSAEILHSIVQTFIETGEPVPSRTISRRASKLSPASIRNIMADLADSGYLSQPHTSAGRIPTAKAFQSFVTSIQLSRTPSFESTRLRQQIHTLESFEDRVECSSHMLTQISKSMGIAASIPTENQILHQVELVALSDRRILMVVVTRDKTVRDKVIQLDREIAPAELETLRNYINTNFSGWTFRSIRNEIRTRLDEERAVYDRLLLRLTSLVEKGLLDIGLAPTLHTEGASNLMGFDLRLTREKMRELFRALEEKQRVLELLDRFLESSGEVAVQVGLGGVHPSMDELALIGVTVNLPGGISAKIAVLGPMRMNYERVMAAVYHVGRAIETAAL